MLDTNIFAFYVEEEDRLSQDVYAILEDYGNKLYMSSESIKELFWINLDSQGCNKIINLISKLTDIDSVFIISHHAQDLELTKDNSIVVEKNEDGISTIKIV